MSRPEKVYGASLTEEHIGAAYSVMIVSGFKAGDIAEALMTAGFPKREEIFLDLQDQDTYVAMRAADRILQYERQLGRIEPLPGRVNGWRWINQDGE